MKNSTSRLLCKSGCCAAFLLASQTVTNHTQAGPLKPGAPPGNSSVIMAAPAASAVSAQPSKAAPQQAPARQTMAPAAVDITPVDLGQAQLGGSVYSTGSEDILLRVLTPVGLPYPDEIYTTVIGGRQVRLPNPNVSAYIDTICILGPGPARSIASNKQYNYTVNLGKLPAGEILFAIKPGEASLLKTGPGSRNVDGLPHAVVKTFTSGIMQVWFEDMVGPRPNGDKDYNDAVFELSGGVSNNNAVAELLKVIKEQKGEAREAAINALRQLNPKALQASLAQR